MTHRPLRVMLCGLVLAAAASAVEPTWDDDAAVRSGSEALRQAADFPWYDPSTDAPAVVTFPTTPPPPELQPGNEAPVARPPGGPDQRSARALWDPLARFVQAAIWGLLAAFFVLAVVAALRTWWRDASSREGHASAESSGLRSSAARVENLPFEMVDRHHDLRAVAQEHFAQGRYGEAILYFFSHGLIQLDRAHLIQLAKGKTNRQYLRELRSHQELQVLLREPMLASEEFFFGAHHIDAQRGEACWAQLAECERLLQLHQEAHQ